MDFHLESKSDALTNFKQWKVLVEKHTNRKVRQMRTNNGLEFRLQDFDNFCKQEGIVRQTTAETPQQN